MDSQISVSKVMQFSGHKDSVYTLCHGFDQGTFFSAGSDGFIVLWTAGKPDGTLWAMVDSPVYALLKYGPHLLAGTRSGVLYIIDSATRQPLKSLKLHQQGIFDIKLIRRDGEAMLVTASGDGSVNMLNSNYDVVRNLPLSHNSIRCLAWHEDSDTLAAGSSDHKIYLINLSSLEVTNLEGHTGSVFSLCYTPEGMLLSGGRDAVLRIWKAGNYQPFTPVNAHWYHINHILPGTTGEYLATASLDKSIKIWQAQTFSLLKVIDREKFEAHSSSVNKLLWLDAETLISCSDDRQVMQFAIKQGTE